MAITSDLSGNTYTTGSFSGQVDFDPGAGVQNYSANGTGDLYVLKLDAAGNFVWALSFGGASTSFTDQGQSIGVGPDGNVYVGGVFNGSVDFDPGPGSFVMNASGNADAFLICLSPQGNFLWGAQLSGNGASENLNAIVFDVNGDVIAGGNFQSTIDFNPGPATFLMTSAGLSDAFIWKLSNAGNFLWAGRIGGSGGNETVFGLTLDNYGNIYSTGSFEGGTDFDPSAGVSNLFSSGGGDPFLCKWTSNGNFVWAKAISGIPDANGSSIAVDNAGNVYATGRFWGNFTDFDPGPGTVNINWFGNFDVYVIKLDSNGLFVWAKGLGSAGEEYGESIALDSNSNLYITGYFTGTVDFNPGPATNNLSATGAFYDSFLLSLDSSGLFRWAKDMNGLSNVQIYDSYRSNNGDIYCTGRFSSTCDFDPGASVFNLTSNGGMDIFVQKFFECTNQGYSITANACSSYTSPSGNFIWTVSGIYNDTIFNSALCDSAYYVITVNLNVLSPSSATVTPTVCGVYVAPDGNQYFTDSTFTVTIPNSAGCDSVITVLLTVENINTTITQSGQDLTVTQSGAIYQWIDCTTNLPINGATNQSYTTTSNGVYAVIVNTANCVDTSLCYVVNSVFIESADAITHQVYPNPATDHITFRLPETTTGYRVWILNSMGQTVLCTAGRESTLQVELGNYASGIYFYRLETDDGQLFRGRFCVRGAQ